MIEWHFQGSKPGLGRTLSANTFLLGCFFAESC